MFCDFSFLIQDSHIRLTHFFKNPETEGGFGREGGLRVLSSDERNQPGGVFQKLYMKVVIPTTYLRGKKIGLYPPFYEY